MTPLAEDYLTLTALPQRELLPPKSSLPPRPSEKTVVTNCSYCGKEMLRYRSTVRLGRGRHCSRACSNADATLRRKPEPIPPTRDCKECGQTFIPTTHHHMFCSVKCNHSFHEKNMPGCFLGASKVVKGEVGELQVVIDLLLRGWHVFRPMCFGCGFDFLITRGDEIRKVEVKIAHKSCKGGALQINLRKTNNPQYDVVATVWHREILYSDKKGETVCL